MNPPFYCKSFVQIRREEARECRAFIARAVATAIGAGVLVGVSIAHCENIRLINATTPQAAAFLVGIAQYK